MRGRFNGYNIQVLHACYSFLHLLRSQGITDINDVILKVEEYIEEQAHLRKMKENKAKYRKQKIKVYDATCEECGGPAYLERVNTGPADQTGDNSKVAILCYDRRNCGHTSYSTKPLDKWPMRWVLAKYDRVKQVRFFDAD